MGPLGERVMAYIHRHSMFSAGQRVGLAVSGGADSMCLLYLLHELAPRWNLHLSVVHIDHGIRAGASRADAEFVRQAAVGFDLQFHFRAADVLAVRDNMEQAARRIRHEFYSELIASGQLDRIATGHTCSDQAETVLYRILRGAGSAGLSGIRPVTRDGLARPLLAVWRPEIEAWLRERNVDWREDATNQDIRLVRNRLRHETLPMLREAYNPNLDQVLAQVALLSQEEEAYWDELLDRSVPSAGSPKKPFLFRAAALADAPAALARRQIRRAIELVKGDLRQIDFCHTEAVLQMAQAGPGHGRTQLPGLDVMRSFEWIRIAPAGFDRLLERDFEVKASIPGRAILPTRTCMTFELREPEGHRESYDKVEEELDWQRLCSISAPKASGDNGARSHLLEVRNWRPGDEYRPAGHSHDKRLKTLFQEERIPLWERRHWPVVTLRGKIVWTRRFGPAAEFAARRGAGASLRIRECMSIE